MPVRSPGANKGVVETTRFVCPPPTGLSPSGAAGTKLTPVRHDGMGEQASEKESRRQRLLRAPGIKQRPWQ